LKKIATLFAQNAGAKFAPMRAKPATLTPALLSARGTHRQAPGEEREEASFSHFLWQFHDNDVLLHFLNNGNVGA